MDINTIKEKIALRLNPERFEHSLGVERLAMELARTHNVNQTKARLAALLHDVSRSMDSEQLLNFAIKLKLKLSKTEKSEPKLLHAKLSRYIAKTEFNVTDIEVLNAIEHHTLGRPNMSTLEKIIFIADHAEAKRIYPEAEAIRTLAKKDLNKAVALSTTCTLKYLKEKKVPIDERTIITHRCYAGGS